MKKMRLKAFTMAEAILVMTILGIIATIMITTLKPAQFKDKGLEIMARKVLSEIDTAITQILINDTQDGSLKKMLDSDYPGATYDFADPLDVNVTTKILKKYLSATRQEVSNSSFCKTNNATAFYLKDGACIGLLTTNAEAVNTSFPGETSEVLFSVGLGQGDATQGSQHAIAALYIDTNGDDEPNVILKDRFVFPIGIHGIKYDIN